MTLPEVGAEFCYFSEMNAADIGINVIRNAYFRYMVLDEFLENTLEY